MGIAKLFAWGYWDTVEQYQFKAARTPKHSRQVEWTVQPNCTACWVCCLYRCILGFALLEASDVCRLAARLDFRQTARLMIKTIRPEVALYSLWSGMGLDAHGKPNGKCRSSGDGWFLLISYRVGVPVGWTCFAEWLQNAVCLTDTKRSALIASLGAFLIQGIMSSASPISMLSMIFNVCVLRLWGNRSFQCVSSYAHALFQYQTGMMHAMWGVTVSWTLLPLFFILLARLPICVFVLRCLTVQAYKPV